MTLNIRRRQLISADGLPSDLHPVLRRVLAARHISCTDDMSLEMQRLHAPSLLKGISGAVELLYQHLQQQNRLLIVSDFDADGATSCALGVRALRSMGFNNVDYIVPNRFEYGYGLTPEIVTLAQQGEPHLIITVDNGISSIEGVEAAHAFGIQVLITDHHLPGRELPLAEAIVNPNQTDCEFPSKALAGVGVIFYLMLALRARLRECNWFIEQQITEPNLADLLDLVALGTIADVVALDRNNRILVNEGLRRIRARKACPGILALLETGRRDVGNIVAADLGFAVGPRLNAAGRLDDMKLGIECLLTDDEHTAKAIAVRLDRINEERKVIETQMRDQALDTLQTIDLNAEQLPFGLCIYNTEWHQGVIGILASRIKDKLHRPVIAFADAGNGEVDTGVMAGSSATKNLAEPEIKGSARSIQGLHIRDVLDTIATRNPGLISRFGGHAMAAGLSIEKRHYERFASAFALEVGRLLNEEALQAVIVSDGELDAQELTLGMAQLLRDNGPWGQSFPEPLFDGVFRVMQQRLLADKHLKLVVSPQNNNTVLDAIAFNVPQGAWPRHDISELRLVYRLDVNEYRGKRNVQLLVEHIEPITAKPTS